MAEKKIMTGLKRIHKLQEGARQLLLSGILIHNPENIFYYTSVYPHEPSFFIVPPAGEPLLIAPRSIYTEAQKECLVPVVPGELDIAQTAYEKMLSTGVLKAPPSTALKSFIRKIGESPLGIEQNYLSVFLLNKLKIRNQTDIGPLIMNMRSQKDSFEIQHIKNACSVADKAMTEIRRAIKPGISELELSGIFDAAAKGMGADETKCKVRSGKNSALAYTRWMDEKLVKGPVLIDYGARIRGYWSDITRMFYLGSEPDALFLQIYDFVLTARSRALEVMNEGQSIHGPETVVRKVFREKGFEKYVVYTAGHGVGLEVHEPPVLNMPESDTRIQNNSDERQSFSSAILPAKDDENLFERGQVFALEPGLYLQDFGVRVEDMVLVSNGPQMLSSLPTNLENIIIPC